MTEIKHFYAVQAALAARMAEATLKAMSALGADEGSVEAAVSLRILLAVQTLLDSLDTIPWNVTSEKVEIDKPANVKPKTSLAEVLKVKDAISKAWGVINFYKPAALNYAMPLYFQRLVKVIERLLDRAEKCLENGLQHAVDAAPLTSPTLLDISSAQAIQSLQDRIGKARGGRRGRLTLAISILDDVQHLAAMLQRSTAPFLEVKKTDSLLKEPPNQIEAALSAVDEALMTGAVHGATVAILLPITQSFFDEAAEVCSEVTEAAQYTAQLE